MQMTMNMASRGFKSTSGSVSVALVVVVLVAVMVAETSAQPGIVLVVNKLDLPLTLIQPATTTIPPRSEETVQVSPQESTVVFQVLNCLFVIPNNVEGRAVSISGTGKLYVTGHCGTGVPGVQFVVTADGGACASLGCAVPLDPSCPGSFS